MADSAAAVAALEKAAAARADPVSAVMEAAGPMVENSAAENTAAENTAAENTAAENTAAVNTRGQQHEEEETP